MITAEAQAASIARIRSFLPVDSLLKADRIAKINGRYIGLTRDIALKRGFDALITSVAVTNLKSIAKPDKRRILGICGESGAGKTTALLEHTMSQPAMQPYVDEEGNQISPLLVFAAPSPCTPRLLAFEALRVIGYPARKDLPEHQMWDLFRTAIKVHKVHWILIDEAQHAIDSATVIESVKIANAFKNLVQMPDWPVRLILAGVEPLGTFLSNKQLANRRSVVLFEKLLGSAGHRTIADVIRLIVHDHATLETSLQEDLDFIQRLAHATEADFGTTVQTIRSAVESAIMADQKSVTIDHFVECYANLSGCKGEENIFIAKHWKELRPNLAILREADLKWQADRPRRTRAAGVHK
ncbi:ATP-binding protein [Rhizobium rhizogenes]|uniref:ATP-binding protein n=1 Tax=Rhizobium rhizogenes TaxID=359 RepID=UPI001573CAB5|nr:ATP-binding protein [Rhizobium rhizogenes]NTF64914.1 AAA family ATPase [Rhizobium rhizogenes]NTG96262.1 AAA family ATPase [Rhizobium rhizogenes]